MAARGVVKYQDRPLPDWFKDRYKDCRWLVRNIDGVGYKFFINPEFPDSKDVVRSIFYSIRPLAIAYVAIDGLSSPVVASCSTTEDTMEYIMKVDQTWIGNGDKITVQNWVDYMNYVQRQLAFAPDFTQWDKHTREMERLAEVAIDESKKAIEAHNPPDKRLPKEVEDGIYVRTRVLQRWIKTSLEPIRAQDDYVEWKRKTDTVTPSSQLRRRQRQSDETNPSPTYQPDVFEILQESGRRSLLQKLGYGLQEDLTVWILNLAIYFPCTIIQAISFSHQAPSNPSSSDYLNALQTTFTQLFSALMTYVLTIRNTTDQNLGMRYHGWFIVAGILPVIALGVLRWHPGISGLLGFLGSAVTGFLQVLLAVDMKRARFLP